LRLRPLVVGGRPEVVGQRFTRWPGRTLQGAQTRLAVSRIALTKAARRRRFEIAARKAKTASHLGLAAEASPIRELVVSRRRRDVQALSPSRALFPSAARVRSADRSPLRSIRGVLQVALASSHEDRNLHQLRRRFGHDEDGRQCARRQAGAFVAQPPRSRCFACSPATAAALIYIRRPLGMFGSTLALARASAVATMVATRTDLDGQLAKSARNFFY
jgi:hypothetical protein